jgi:hypothetical protein
MVYVPRPLAFGPSPAILKFSALRPRFTVTDAACATNAVSSNPSRQKAICEMDFSLGVIVGSACSRILIEGFIDASPPGGLDFGTRSGLGF